MVETTVTGVGALKPIMKTKLEPEEILHTIESELSTALNSFDHSLR